MRYRPGYPPDVLSLLKKECGLTRDSTVADIGSGTGILSRVFLESGCRVFGIEPNEEMRRVGERLLAAHGGFTSVAATAEATTLADGSVGFVTAGQAFHWFEPERARVEFDRILKPDGWVMLVWNARLREEKRTAFLEAYERLLDVHATDYREAGYGQRGSLREVQKFFDPEPVSTANFDNRQVLDFDGLRGRLLSSSYVPAEGQPGYEEMLQELERIFREHEKDGKVVVEYDTKVYYGRLG